MEQKEIAIQCLERLDIYKPYIRKFKSKASIPCFFENFGGYYVDQEPEIWNKVKEVEKENGGLVYAITHEELTSGKCGRCSTYRETAMLWKMFLIPLAQENSTYSLTSGISLMIYSRNSATS